MIQNSKNNRTRVLITALLFTSISFLAASCESAPDLSTPAETDRTVQSVSVRYYRNGFGGTLYGLTEQTIPWGGDGKPVSAAAKAGFTFTGWNDGVTSPVHIAGSVTGNKDIAAQFEQIYSDLPVISIYTETGEGITSKEEYLNCTVTVSDPDNRENCGEFSAQIRGRGNATWNFSKKSYKVKFSRKVNLLSTGDAVCKDWTLISCYGDQTMLRNYAAFRLGQQLDGIEWTPACSFAEVYLNGVYIGVYMVADQVEENDGRIELETAADGEVDRDYLIELDMYAAGEQFIDYVTSGGKPYSIKSEISDAEMGKFLYEYLQAVDEAVEEGTYEAVSRYIDMDSLVDTYILQEYTKNIDVGWSSLYMVKRAGGKLYFTAPWDFDLAFGNDYRLDNGSYHQLYAGEGRDGFGQNNNWFISLWKQRWFKELVAERWSELTDILDSLEAEVVEAGKALIIPMERNYQKWQVLTTRTHMQPDQVLALDSYMEQVEYLSEWMDGRQNYLNNVFKQYLK